MVILPGCGCDCGPPCTTVAAASGGSGTTVNTHEFPSEKHCIWFSSQAYDIPDEFTVKVCGETVLFFESGGGLREKCFQKPEGCTEVEVKVVGEEGTGWNYSLSCEGCPEFVPQVCCKSVGDERCPSVRKCVIEGLEPLEPCPTTTSNCEYCDIANQDIGIGPPYDCLNNEFLSGAWVTVSGWSAYTGDRSVLDADLVALYEEAESKVNQTFHVPFGCLGSGQVTLDLGAGESRDTRDCSGAHWFANVVVNLCARTASVAVSNNACFDSTDIQIDLGELTAIPVSCNSWTGCNCEGYDDTIPINFFVGGGRASVSSSV
jgi:hypothetical protein